MGEDLDGAGRGAVLFGVQYSRLMLNSRVRAELWHDGGRVAVRDEVGTLVTA